MKNAFKAILEQMLEPAKVWIYVLIQLMIQSQKSAFVNLTSTTMKNFKPACPRIVCNKRAIVKDVKMDMNDFQMVHVIYYFAGKNLMNRLVSYVKMGLWEVTLEFVFPKIV